MIIRNKKMVFLGCLIFLGTGCSREQRLKENGWKEEKQVPTTYKSFDFENFEDVKNETEKNVDYSKNRLKNNPNDPAGLYQLGTYYLMNKINKNEGILLLKRSRKLAGDNLFIRIGVAQFLEMYALSENKIYIQNLLNELEELIPRLSDTDSVAAEHYVNVGKIYEALGEFNKSKELYEKSMKLQPDDIYLTSGKTFFVMKGIHGKYEKLLKNLEKIIE